LCGYDDVQTKYLTIEEKMRLLEFYEKENVSAPALADNKTIKRKTKSINNINDVV